MSLLSLYLIPKKLLRFRRSDDGGLTVFGLFIFLIALVLGGLAIDVSHLVAERTKLQITADTAAHAAIYNRDSLSDENAKDAAMAIASNSMPPSVYGNVLAREDIVFGIYDRSTQQFTVDSSSRTAVLVTLERHASKNNAVLSFLTQFVGVSQWDLSSQAVFETFRPACLREGFVAEGIVDMQSNNGFSNGFCIHSNTHVELNSNNSFEAGTIVSMPDLDDLELPRSGFESNDGLQTALREGRQHIRILNQMEDIYNDLLVFDSQFNPPFITDNTIYTPSGSRFEATDFVSGRMYYFDCNSRITLNSSGGTYSGIVILAECPVKFGSDVVLEDVTILSTSTSANSFTAAAGLTVGRDDNCAPDGGAQLLTFGGMRFPADMKMYGGQLIALGDIEFAANANGIEGASMIAGGRIDGTSNMEMAFCGSGMENNFEANYFRMAL